MIIDGGENEENRHKGRGAALSQWCTEMSQMRRRLEEEHNILKLDKRNRGVLDVINDNKFSQTGAFNLRENGTSICHGDSEHIKIKKKMDKAGIDIYIDGKTDGEAVYIPVVRANQA